MPKATIEIPEGMTAERMLQIIESYESRSKSGEAQRKQRAFAVDKLVKAHQAEYDKYREEAKTAVKV